MTEEPGGPHGDAEVVLDLVAGQMLRIKDGSTSEVHLYVEER